MPNKLSNFWQELKRRNVVHVVTVYAGAAFVIIELINNVTEPLKLPEWTPTLVIILLLIGFPITVIFSWVYDIHPEDGLVRTEPAHKVKSEELPKSSNSWKIASYISFVVIVGLIVLNIIPRAGKKENLEKSIAILPFINDSPDEEKMYFINGTMEAILDNLSKIEDLRVVSRTSVEQYRNNLKPIPVVAEEMDVSYVLEGSGHRDGDNVRIFVQLLDGRKDQHLWSRTYEGKIDDIFSMLSEIAQQVASEIESVITPEEKERIEKVPTSSHMANEQYQMGRDEYIKFLLNVRDRDALTRAREYYLKALEYDPNYAKACAGMAMTFYSKLAVQGKLFLIYFDGYLEDDAFDTVFIWADRAIHIDNQLPEAYYIRGNYYFETGQREKAEQDYRRAIQLNPNFWEAYYGLGNMYTSIDYIRVFENFKKAFSLVRGPELSYILNMIIQTYTMTGNLEQAEPLLSDYVNLTQDSLIYYTSNSTTEFINERLENQHYWLLRAYAYDSTNPIVISNLAECCINMGNIEEGLEYYKQSGYLNHKLERIDFNRLHRIGYAFWLAGNKEEADDYFDRAEKICKSMIRLDRPYAQWGMSQLDLLLIYAFRGEKSKAMEILRDLQQRSNRAIFVAWYLQRDHMLNGIRDDPEFQQIANDLDVKFWAEIQRIRQWIDENDIL